MMRKLFATVQIGSVRTWHWISSALCLVGMLLFAFTGITLNHAGDIKVQPRVTTIEAVLPEALLRRTQELAVSIEEAELRFNEPLRRWLSEQDIDVGGKKAQWSSEEIYLSMPRPGGDAWLAIDLVTGDLLYEATDRGGISYLNDLHKGRNTGVAWAWFLDVFSVACLVFCVTGLWLLYRHSGSRSSTWPLVGLGLVIPLLLVILFVHG